MHDQIPMDERGESASGYLTIDLGALRRNYFILSDRAAPARVAAVVKADAYGLAAERIAPVLYQAGCRDFFVAHLREALPLRNQLSAEARIFVLNGLQPGAAGIAAERGIVPVLNSFEQLLDWAAHANAACRELPAVLQFDTGMSRLGLSELEISQLLKDRSLLHGVDVLFIMSHLASSDEPDSDQNAAQLQRMVRLSGAFPDSRVCFANSGGVLLDSAFHGALVRPGIALYGGAPSSTLPNPMQPVVRLDVAVIQTRVIPAATRVGYGGSFTAHESMCLATIAAGYADGLPRSLGDRGAAYYAGTRLPIVGRVSMDSMTLDVSALPPATLKLGSLVEIIGPNQTLEMLAADASTISYEILTSLGRRYSRRYVDTVGADLIPPRAT